MIEILLHTVLLHALIVCQVIDVSQIFNLRGLFPIRLFFFTPKLYAVRHVLSVTLITASHKNKWVKNV